MTGSAALAIPLPLFKGSLEFSEGINPAAISESNDNLKRFCNYLGEDTDLKSRFNLTQLNIDLAKGLFLNSNAPSGYGVGSSAILVAAIFDAYFKQNDTLTIRELKPLFAKMESFFHGKSSGFDPLVCYLRKSFLIDDDGRQLMVDASHQSTLPGTFLIDTKMSRETAPLVAIFKTKLEDSKFKNAIIHTLNPLVKSCVSSYLDFNESAFFSNLRSLSDFQLKHFHEMIPSAFLSHWKNGLYSENYFLKLCGAGGGGFILGFTKKLSNIQHLAESLDVHILDLKVAS